VLWQGTTQKLPILLYHSVAPTGSEASTDYRVTPEAFEQQLKYLRDHGYQSASPEDCYNWFYEFSHLPRGSVFITFDDGYRDFREYAWPLLQHYGFSAHVFLVAGLVGKTNVWDEHLMGTKPLLDWDEIRQLQSQGATFRSHSLTNPTLPSTSLKMVWREFVQSHEIIEQELGNPIKTFAYPYGEFNRRILYLAGLCEYDLGVTCESDICTLTSSPIAMPRIEIEGQDSLDVFAEKIPELSETHSSDRDRVDR
jgi:peptidoglycan/xylan/chitin deacetylase (PgdA/CDA1 family)